MNRRRQILQHQQQRFHRHASNCDAYAFFNLLTAPELLQRVESALPEYRERLFPPKKTGTDHNYETDRLEGPKIVVCPRFLVMAIKD